MARKTWGALLGLALVKIIAYGTGSLRVHRSMCALFAPQLGSLPASHAAAHTPYFAVLERPATTLPDPSMITIVTAPRSPGPRWPCLRLRRRCAALPRDSRQAKTLAFSYSSGDRSPFRS